MLIIKTEEDRERCTSCYGNRTIELTIRQNIIAKCSRALERYENSGEL